MSEEKPRFKILVLDDHSRVVFEGFADEIDVKEEDVNKDEDGFSYWRFGDVHWPKYEYKFTSTLIKPDFQDYVYRIYRHD